MVIDNAYLNEDEAEYELHGQVPPLRDEFHLRDVGELALALAVGLAGPGLQHMTIKFLLFVFCLFYLFSILFRMLTAFGSIFGQ